MAVSKDTSPIPGVASLDLAPLPNRDFDPVDAAMTPEDYFVLTRCDGRTSFKQICLIAGFPEAQTLTILAKLRTVGAILLPGEPPPPRRLRGSTGAPTRASSVVSPAVTPPPRPAPPSTAPPLASGTSPQGLRPPGLEKPPTQPPAGKPPTNPPRGKPATVPPASATPPHGTAAPGAQEWVPPFRPPPLPASLAAEDVDLSLEQKKAIFAKHALVPHGSLFDVLEVLPTVDKKGLKRAYFRLSKDFHPDRYYGKKLGSFHDMLQEIFKTATDAFELLDDDGKRETYKQRVLAEQGGGGVPVAAPTAETSAAVAKASRNDRAAELFDLACQHEVTGQVDLALAEFSAAIQLDPTPRYLRRATEACLRAQKLRSAEEYAKKFAILSPRDAIAHSMLAKVLRALGRIEEAHSELETASRLDPGSAHIAAELEELRKLVRP